LNELSGTLWACHYTGDEDLWVVEVSSIMACVSMQPLPLALNNPPGLWFAVKKSEMEDFQLSGFEESIDNDSREPCRGL
jgi:hypothetical protein